MVCSVDGKATLRQGQHPRPLGSRVDRTIMARLRAHADAVLRGAGTVRRNPYYPRAARGGPADEPRDQPLACVVSASGSLPVDSPFFTRAPRRPLVVLGPLAPAGCEEQFVAVADVVRAPQASAAPGEDGAGWVDPGWLLRHLRERYGVRLVVSEGGPHLNYRFFRAGCVDELFLTLAPFLAGSERELGLVHGPQLLEPFPELRLVSVFAHESELFLRYQVLSGPQPGDRRDGGQAPAGPPGYGAPSA